MRKGLLVCALLCTAFVLTAASAHAFLLCCPGTFPDAFYHTGAGQTCSAADSATVSYLYSEADSACGGAAYTCHGSISYVEECYEDSGGHQIDSSAWHYYACKIPCGN